MKKFLSLFCALSIILSASAAPVNKKSRLEKFAKVHAKELKTQKEFSESKTTKTVRAFGLQQKAVTPKHVRLADTKNALRAPKALAEAQQVTIGSIDTQDWGGDVQYFLYSTDNTVAFVFDIYYAEGLDDVELGKKYTLGDMDAEYSEIFYNSEYHGLKAAEFTKTIDDQNLVHIVGSCTDTLDVSFTFQYDEVPFVPTGDTIRFSLDGKARFKRYSSYGQWHVAAEGEKYAFSADYYSDDEVSPLKVDSLDYGYCHVEIFNPKDTSWLQIAPYKENVSLKISKDGEIILVEMALLGEDGNVYEAKATFVEPKKEAEETITADNLIWNIENNWFYYAITYIGYTDKYGVALQAQSSAASAIGEFEVGDDMSGYIFLFSETDTTQVELYSGKVSVTKEGKTTTLSGKVLAFNNTEYTLNLQYALPEPTSNYTITASAAELTNLGGAWQLFAPADDENSYITLAAYADEIAGAYTAEDLVDQYTFAGIFLNGDTAWYNMLDANLQIVENGETVTLSGTFLGQNEINPADVVNFTLNITAVVAEPEDDTYKYDEASDFGRHFASYEIDDSDLAEYGSLYVIAQDAEDYYIILDITLPEGATELVAGEYPIAEQYLTQTVHAGSYYADYESVVPSYAATLIEQGDKMYLDKIWYLVAGTVTITESGVIEVQAENSLGNKVTARLGEYPEGIENTDADVIATKRVVNGNLVIEKNGVKYNAIGTILK